MPIHIPGVTMSQNTPLPSDLIALRRGLDLLLLSLLLLSGDPDPENHENSHGREGLDELDLHLSSFLPLGGDQ